MLSDDAAFLNKPGEPPFLVFLNKAGQSVEVSKMQKWMCAQIFLTMNHELQDISMEFIMSGRLI
jgi:hypothetical protein